MNRLQILAFASSVIIGNGGQVITSQYGNFRTGVTVNEKVTPPLIRISTRISRTAWKPASGSY